MVFKFTEKHFQRIFRLGTGLVLFWTVVIAVLPYSGGWVTSTVVSVFRRSRPSAWLAAKKVGGIRQRSCFGANHDYAG